MCDGWRLGGFKQFIVDMGPKPAPRYELDRIDNDGGYWCGHCEECLREGHIKNCRWVTHQENLNNRRNSLTEAERLLGDRAHLVRGRLALGWDEERANTERVHIKGVSWRVAMYKRWGALYMGPEDDQIASEILDDLELEFGPMIVRSAPSVLSWSEAVAAMSWKEEGEVEEEEIP